MSAKHQPSGAPVRRAGCRRALSKNRKTTPCKVEGHTCKPYAVSRPGMRKWPVVGSIEGREKFDTSGKSPALAHHRGSRPSHQVAHSGSALAGPEMYRAQIRMGIRYLRWTGTAQDLKEAVKLRRSMSAYGGRPEVVGEGSKRRD